MHLWEQGSPSIAHCEDRNTLIEQTAALQTTLIEHSQATSKPS